MAKINQDGTISYNKISKLAVVHASYQVSFSDKKHTDNLIWFATLVQGLFRPR